jgi:hypothetical protein
VRGERNGEGGEEDQKEEKETGRDEIKRSELQ